MSPRPVLRTCVGCRTIKEQQALIRFGVNTAGKIEMSPARGRGRGAYLCPSMSCYSRAWQRQSLLRAFRRGVHAANGVTLRQRFEAELRRRGIMPGWG